MYIIEKKKPNYLTEKTISLYVRIGILVIGSLIIFTTVNDLNNVGIFKFFQSLIS